MMIHPILIEDRKNTRIIRFNRIDKKNAITQAMYQTMANTIKTAPDDGIGVLIFLGQEEVFSAGNDVMDFMNSAMGADFRTSSTMNFLHALATCPLPMIAGVDGLAIGIGTTMLMHCDMVFASTRAYFKTPFLNLGLVPEAGSSLIAPKMMGYQKAFELLILGETFTSLDAKEAGLINHIVTSEQLEEKCLETAEKLTTLAPQALELSRTLLKGSFDEIIKRINEEAVLFMERLSSEEAKEAFMAFSEKRAANFQK